MENFVHECIEVGLLAWELHRQESVTFFRSICIGSPTVNSGAHPGVAETERAHFQIEKISRCCREACRELPCASRQVERRSRRVRLVMELLYASRQSASDVLRVRANLLAEFRTRMHRDGPARCGTPQARIGHFFGVDLYRESHSKF